MIIYEWVANLFILALSLLMLGACTIMMPAAIDIIITWFKKRDEA